MRDRTSCRTRGATRIGALAALVLLALVGALVGGLVRPVEARATVAGVDASTLVWQTDNRVYYGTYNTPVFTTSEANGRVSFAYCIDPTCAVPDAGSYATVSVENFCPERSSLVRAALWFGYGGPGFDPSMWPDTWYDGTTMDAGAYYAATHLILSYATTWRTGYTYYNSGSEFIAYSAATYLGVDLNANVTNENSTMFQMFARAGEVPSNFVCYYLDCGEWDHTQYIVSHDYYVQTGSIVLQKSSAAPSITDGNALYSLAGASYGVYADEACTQLAATLTTDAAGTARADDLSAGTYWVRELAAPTGYLLDQSVRSVAVEALGTATLSVADTPAYATPALVATKTDAQTGGQAQGGASLAGALFRVNYYAGTYQLDTLPASPTRSWTFATDATGTAAFAASSKVAGDGLYLDGAGNAAIPPGTVTVQEVAAPEGYLLSDSAVRVYHVGADGGFDASTGALAASVSDEVIRGGVRVVKADAETADGAAQGSATLAGAVFSVVSLNDQPVVVGSTTYRRGETVATLTTDASGCAATGANDLPYGTYELREVAAPAGYALSDAALTVEVRSNGQLCEAGSPCTDSVLRGGVLVHKADAETADGSAQGDATLGGATFAVVSLNDRAVVVGGVTYRRGETVMTLTADATGTAASGNRDLPCGTYEVREVAAPRGYALSDASATVTVAGDGVVSEVEAPFTDAVLRGGLSIQKVDADTGLNEAQGSATLAGAAFSVTVASERPVVVGGITYQPGDAVATLTTDENGCAATGANDLPYGTYELREVEAPEGYLPSDETWTVEVRESGVLASAELPCRDAVVRGGVRVVKADAETADGCAQGDATLAGAVFSVVSLNDWAVVVGGETYQPGNTVATLVTDESGYAATGERDLPYGVYELREVEAPEGYALSEVTATVTVDSDGVVSEVESPVTDDVLRGGLSVQKVDADTGLNGAQGSATLAGAMFSVAVAGEQPVVVGGTAYQPGDAVATLVTDENGYAATGERDLPYGTYELKEVAAPDGYLPSDEIWTVEVREDGAVASAEAPCRDAVVRGGVRVVKADAEADGGCAQGSATLAGAVFSVVSLNEQAVVVGGETYQPGDVVATLVTDESGCAATGERDLPHGTYEVREVAAPDGYLLDDAQVQTFAVEQDGVVVDLAEAFRDRVVRGGVSVQKNDRDLDRGEALADATLAGTAFAVVNGNGQSVLVDGAWFAPGEQVLTLTTDATGYAQSSPDALPYGSYQVFELSASEGYVLSDASCLTVEVSQDGATVACERPFANRVARGDVSGVKVESGTGEPMAGVAFAVSSLTTGERHVVVADEAGRFGTACELAPHTSGTNANDLALAADGGVADESLLSSENGVWFSGTAGDATQPEDALGALPFDVYRFEELATTASYGHTLVSFDVAVRADGTVVDLGFVDDTPIALHTQAVVAATGADEGMPDANGAVVDTVSYTGLVPGATYQLEGTLVDRSTGEALLDEDGAAITALQTFTPEKDAGTVEVTIPLDSSELLGTRATVFERLSLDGTELASHTDRYDSDQTVRFVAIQTEALGQTSGTHEEQAQEETVLVDTVTYSGLTPGRPYELSARLVLADDGAEVLDAGGEAVTAHASFVPLAPNGTVEVELSFDALDYAGQTVVVCEELLQDGTPIAAHAELDDADQSVALLAVATQAHDAATQTNDALASEDATVVDEVFYQGLTAGDEYELHGMLVDAQTGVPVSAADGTAVAAEVTFSPTGRDGVQEVSFDLDATQLAGTSTVVVESLVHDGVIVASHAELDDEAQTVRWHVEEDMPVLGDRGTESPLASVAGGAALAAIGVGLLLIGRKHSTL